MDFFASGQDAGTVPTPLETSLDLAGMQWLEQHVCDLLAGMPMGGMRTKMERYEKRMDDYYRDREAMGDVETHTMETIFSKRNETLGTVAGFVDFAYAQAKDDIFGDDEWLSVQPVGRNDIILAGQIRKHAPMKLERGGFVSAGQDALRIAANLGTAFMLTSWEEVTETYEARKPALYVDGQPVAGPDGRPITVPLVAFSQAPFKSEQGDGALVRAGKAVANAVSPGRRMVHPEGMPDMLFPADKAEMREGDLEETVLVKQGVKFSLVDFRDIFFRETASEFDLMQTPIIRRFKIGLLDAKALFDLDGEAWHHAKTLAEAREMTGEEEAKDHRQEEKEAELPDTTDEAANPQIVLYEAYCRADPLKIGNPSRLYVVFSPAIQKVLFCDYLANRTPGGALPIAPVRWWRVPGRICGKGYWEVLEDQNDAIDKLHSAVLYNESMSNTPMPGYDPEALEDPDSINGPYDLSKPQRLKPGKKMGDFLSFTSFPDLNSRAIEVMNQKLQMIQMRTGITSAAQGELSGVPSANTATGTRDLQSRGAKILKWPISDAREDLEVSATYGCKVLYANQNVDETFSWGEGTTRELIQLKADQVKNLEIDVTFQISQTQELEMRENTAQAIGLVMQYLQIPEPEKATVRELFIQALNLLGFRNSEQIIREPIAMAPTVPGMEMASTEQPPPEQA